MLRATGPSQGTSHDCGEEQSMPIDEGKSTGLCELIPTQPVGSHQRDQHPAGPHGPDGGDPPRSCAPPSKPDRERAAVDASEGGTRPLDAETRMNLEAECFASQQLGKAEFDFNVTDQETHMAECNRLIRQFRKELKQAQIVLQPSKTRKRCVLFEVMCSPQSELTRQCTQLNVHARRFGREQGDLSTTSGRKNLFAHLIIEQPEHVWIAPECRPWCRWSLFNEQRSLEHFLQVAAERIENIWQIALCVVLCEHQLNNDRHFHWSNRTGHFFSNILI